MIRMKKKAVAVVTAVALAGGIYAGSYLTKPSETVTPVEPAPVAHYVDQQAVINALSTKAQIVGLTGKVAKTITLKNDKWFGDKTYELAATGEFKLGVNTSDIIITTKGNTVNVKFPQPKIISVDIPFDKAELSKDVSWTRKDISETELQAMFGKARTGAVEDIKRDRQAFEKASDSVERTIEALIESVDDVEDVNFEEAN
jgi:galactitol-specific phosphotransferase system IIB component